MSRSRKGRRGYKLPPGKFASIPVDVLRNATGILTACELRVWLALCAQSQPWSNGTAKLCRSVVKEFHLGSWTTVTAATEKMLEAKLIVRTRKFRPRHCALYGVTHMALNADALAKENASELATDSRSEILATGAVARTHAASSKSSQAGPDSLQRLYRIKEKTAPNSLQVLYQSKTLPPLSADKPSSPISETRDSQRTAPVAKIEKLDRIQPHLTHADVAEITGEPIELVQQVRAPR